MIPQAYTARDIGDAYKWLQTLPPHVREEMKTMEQMVLNFLKAKAMGNLSNYQPQKTQEFQKTLQNLKVEMDQFDYVPTSNQTMQVSPTNQTANPTQQNQPGEQTPPNFLSALKLDPKSRQIVSEIRDGFNLSSDIEVIRMSLVLAHKTLKSLLS